MDRSEQRQDQHLGLATVCAIVYHAVTGEIPDPGRAAEMDATLNEVAHALAIAVPIHAPDPHSGVAKRVSPFALSEGEFSRGAQVFTHKSGEQFRGLTVQRRDMESAITIFRSAQVSFRRPAS